MINYIEISIFKMSASIETYHILERHKYFVDLYFNIQAQSHFLFSINNMKIWYFLFIQ